MPNDYPHLRAAEHLLDSLRVVLERTLRYSVSNSTGDVVAIAGHAGDHAREVDIGATAVMRAAVAELFPSAEFLAEDLDDADVWAAPHQTSGDCAVWVGDALDGTRQHFDLGFGFGCAASVHVRTESAGRWEQVAAGVVNSSGRFAGHALGATTELHHAEFRPGPTIVINASRARDLHLLDALRSVLPADGRVWNSAGNPVVPQLLHTSHGVLIQPRPAAQWDAIGVSILAAAGFTILRLDRADDPRVEYPDVARLFAAPQLQGERPIPPVVVGPDEDFTWDVWKALRMMTRLAS